MGMYSNVSPRLVMAQKMGLDLADYADRIVFESVEEAVMSEPLRAKAQMHGPVWTYTGPSKRTLAKRQAKLLRRKR